MEMQGKHPLTDIRGASDPKLHVVGQGEQVGTLNQQKIDSDEIIEDLRRWNRWGDEGDARDTIVATGETAVELGCGGPITRGESRGKNSSSVCWAPIPIIKRNMSRPDSFDIKIGPR